MAIILTSKILMKGAVKLFVVNEDDDFCTTDDLGLITDDVTSSDDFGYVTEEISAACDLGLVTQAVQ